MNKIVDSVRVEFDESESAARQPYLEYRATLLRARWFGARSNAKEYRRNS